MCDVALAVQCVYGLSVRKVKMRPLGRGLGMRERNGSEWEVSQLLFADDTALVASSEERLQRLVEGGS